MSDFKRKMAATYAQNLKDRLAAIPHIAKPFYSETDIPHLKWMCDRIISLPEEMSDTKLNRWIGYIQGVMAARGLTTVEFERHNYLEVKEKLMASVNKDTQ